MIPEQYGVVIRPEVPRDFSAVRHLLIEAFRDAPFSDHQEHILVERLRKSPSYLPHLTLVALIGQNPVGFLMLTRATVESGEASTPVLLLAPLAVLPVRQGMGIGSQLMRTAHIRAENAGFPAVVLMGSPAYYARHGYQPCADFGIRFREDIPQQYTVVRQLSDRPVPTGNLLWDSAFDR